MWVFNQFLKITILTLSTFWMWSSIALTEVNERNLTIDANSQSYNALIKKAETLAKQSIEQAFKENSTLESMTIMILGERGSQVVPILRTRVTRSQWQTNSEVSEWTRYFPPSESLLGYNQPKPTESASGSGSSRRTRPQSTTQQTRPQPSTSPVPPPPPTTAQTPATETTPEPTSPQTRPDPTNSPNIIRLEPSRSGGRSRIENDPGFRDD
ncbi:hypothetical protein ACL6C3_28010 [Capilliphycus salinus ALCB114379]|uniref:hypothetical protein n=1 Tax=Capilliphycus salinus TaxID=2768948 RepID=UPI0039A6DC5B